MSETKKYEFTGEEKKSDEIVLKRIRALRDFGYVKKDDVGGWIEKEENLSHCGDAWVFENAEVSGTARVFEDARVGEDARVYGNAWVSKDAEICTPRDFLTVGPIGSGDKHTTFFKLLGGNVGVKCGCFGGTIEEFLEKVAETHKDTDHAVAYGLAAELAKTRMCPAIDADKTAEENGK